MQEAVCSGLVLQARADCSKAQQKSGPDEAYPWENYGGANLKNE